MDGSPDRWALSLVAALLGLSLVALIIWLVRLRAEVKQLRDIAPAQRRPVQRPPFPTTQSQREHAHMN